MDIADVLQTAFMSLYTFVLVMVSIYGLHRYFIVYLFLRHRHKTPTPVGHFTELPRVTVQLPMYNEETVARRIIEETARIDYPSDKLQIQVLDDSTDDTCRIAIETVDSLKAQGVDIQYLHREDRTGYKAGALDAAMPHVTGEFITIFDADFIPRSDVLQRSIHHFMDPDVCVVQTRWEHLNRDDSWLTKAQGIFLDGHFAIEHVARNRSERFISFNGTAGTWRKTAIAAAGGWHHDTLTEDLDLSYRAQLKGWKFVFLPEVTAPAELPPEMSAFKAQQFRWTKGGAQVAIKLLPKIMMSKASLKVKIESFFHLTGFCLHIYMFALVIMLFPAIFLRTVAVQDSSIWRSVIDMGVFVLATMSAFVFYLASQLQLSRDWRTVFKFMPMLMALGVGICISNSKGIIEALAGKQSEFVRTPKYGRGGRHAAGATTKRKSRKLLPYIEFAFGIYMTVCAIFSIVYIRAALTAPFLLIFAFGFFYVSVLSFQSERAANPVKEKALPVEETA